MILSTVNSRFKKDLNLQIHLHKAFFSDNRFLDSYHKSFLNQTTLDLRKKKWSFLNREFTVPFLFFKKMLKFKFGIFLKCFYFSFSRCGIQQSKQFKRIEFRGRSQAGGHFKGHFRCHFALVTTIHRVTGQSAPFSANEHYSRPFRSTSRPNKIK